MSPEACTTNQTGVHVTGTLLATIAPLTASIGTLSGELASLKTSLDGLVAGLELGAVLVGSIPVVGVAMRVGTKAAKQVFKGSRDGVKRTNKQLGGSCRKVEAIEGKVGTVDGLSAAGLGLIATLPATLSLVAMTLIMLTFLSPLTWLFEWIPLDSLFEGIFPKITLVDLGVKFSMFDFLDGLSLPLERFYNVTFQALKVPLASLQSMFDELPSLLPQDIMAPCVAVS